jgi:hypothetical protein
MDCNNFDRVYFHETCDYKNILMVTKQELMRKGMPLELIRGVLLQVRVDLLHSLAEIVDSGYRVVSDVILVEFVNAMFRMEPFKAMINLVRLQIGADCLLTFPADADVPLEMPELTTRGFLNFNFRIQNRPMSSDWDEYVDPECDGFVYLSGGIYRLVNPEN